MARLPHFVSYGAPVVHERSSTIILELLASNHLTCK